MPVKPNVQMMPTVGPLNVVLDIALGGKMAYAQSHNHHEHLIRVEQMLLVSTLFTLFFAKFFLYN